MCTGTVVKLLTRRGCKGERFGKRRRKGEGREKEREERRRVCETMLCTITLHVHVYMYSCNNGHTLKFTMMTA